MVVTPKRPFARTARCTIQLVWWKFDKEIGLVVGKVIASRPWDLETFWHTGPGKVCSEEAKSIGFVQK